MTTKLIIGNKNYSSWSLRPWLLLKESDIEFDEHRISLDTPEFAHEVSIFSPAGRVPILQCDDITVWDSLAIAETIAERWPEKSLWPKDAAMRAHARAVCAEMHSGFTQLRSCMPMNCRAMGRKVSSSDELARDIDRVIAIWSDCQRKYGEQGDWLFGEFSIADAMFAPVVFRFRTYGIKLPESAENFPRRLLESAAMQDWLLAAEAEIEVVKFDEAGQ